MWKFTELVVFPCWDGGVTVTVSGALGPGSGSQRKGPQAGSKLLRQGLPGAGGAGAGGAGVGGGGGTVVLPWIDGTGVGVLVVVESWGNNGTPATTPAPVVVVVPAAKSSADVTFLPSSPEFRMTPGMAATRTTATAASNPQRKRLWEISPWSYMASPGW